MKVVHRHPEHPTEAARRQSLLELHERCVRLLRAAGRDRAPGAAVSGGRGRTPDR